MAVTMRVDIVSAEGQVFSGSASFVVLPGVMGELGVYPGHAPLLTKLRPGSVRVTDESGEKMTIVIAGGLLEIQATVITVLADMAIRSDEMDAARVAAAEKKARETLLKSHCSEEDKLLLIKELSYLQAQLAVLESRHGKKVPH